MSRLFWYYGVLQGLVLVLILLALKEHNQMKSIVRVEEMRENIASERNRGLNRVEHCVRGNFVDKLVKLRDSFRINAYSSGFDPVIGYNRSNPGEVEIDYKVR